MVLNENTESKHLDFLEYVSLSQFISLTAIVITRYIGSVVLESFFFNL